MGDGFGDVALVVASAMRARLHDRDPDHAKDAVVFSVSPWLPVMR
jgi:hypothetical protein